MKQYGYVRAIFSSFYSRDLYRDVARNWGGGIFAYMLLLAMLGCALVVLAIQPFINTHLEKFVSAVVVEMPPIVIHDGEVKTPENKPYVLHDPWSKEVVAVIDTSGKYKTLDAAKSQALLTKDQFMYFDQNNVLQAQALSKNLNLDVQPVVVKEKVIKMSRYVWVGLYPLLVILGFIGFVVHGFLLGLFGKFLAMLMDVRLAFTNSFKLAIIALTPVYLVQSVLFVRSMQWHISWCWAFLITMFYLIYAIASNKNGA